MHLCNFTCGGFTEYFPFWTNNTKYLNIYKKRILLEKERHWKKERKQSHTEFWIKSSSSLKINNYLFLPWISSWISAHVYSSFPWAELERGHWNSSCLMLLGQSILLLLLLLLFFCIGHWETSRDFDTFWKTKAVWSRRTHRVFLRTISFFRRKRKKEDSHLI